MLHETANRKRNGRLGAKKRDRAIKVYFTEEEESALRATAEIEKKSIALVLRESFMKRHRAQGAPVVAGQSEMAFNANGDYLGVATKVDGQVVITP